MRKTLALILLLFAASLPLMGNISFAPDGAAWLSDGGVIWLRSSITPPTPDPSGMSPNDVTATMTSTNAPSPNVVYKITSFGVLGDTWLAFDHDIVSTGTYDYFSADRQGVEFGFDFGASFPHAIQTVRFLGYAANNNPKSFKIIGSNGAASTTLYTGTGTTSLDWQTFTWTNTTEYRYISFQSVTTQAAAALKLMEVEYWENQP